MADEFMQQGDKPDSDYWGNRRQRFMSELNKGIEAASGMVRKTTKRAPIVRAPKTDAVTPKSTEKSHKSPNTAKKTPPIVTKPSRTVTKTVSKPKDVKPKAEAKGPKDLSKMPKGLANYWRRQRGEKEVK